MKLRKQGKIEKRMIEKSDGSIEEIEGDLWEDLDGNVYGWTPKNSGVISIEIKNGEEEEMIKTHYKKLKQKGRLSQEERIATLEEALTAALKRIAELGG